MAKLGAVILAAGAGTRLGGAAKALLPHAAHGGRTYLEVIAATARAVGLADGVVVVGPPYGDAVAGHARALGLRVAVNGEPARGMASSVAIGFAAIADGDADADAAWLWPVDHPDVRADSLARIAAALDGHEVAQPRFEGRGGHPPLIARAAWPRLAGCAAAPGGARAVLAGLDVVAIEVEDPGVVRDVDTPADAAMRGAP
ncbi:MAG TPA: NTP transferase domain-containing protein [Kofleriaceae bacterium]|nr:NTP transferase domain-containing protein [Kofleriaceae bacterium]